MISNFRKTLKEIQSDIDRFKQINNKSYLFNLLKKPGLWISTQYRFSKWVKVHCEIPVLRQLLRLMCATWEQINQVLLHCEFPNTAEIGAGVYMPHPYSIVIHGDARIGSNCHLSQNVTIGVGGRGANSGVPRIGDRVYIAPGAKIFGAITIGNDVAIGANAVVTKDLPDNAVAVGIPAKIISYQGSQDFVHSEKVESVDSNNTKTTIVVAKIMGNS